MKMMMKTTTSVGTRKKVEYLDDRLALESIKKRKHADNQNFHS